VSEGAVFAPATVPGSGETPVTDTPPEVSISSPTDSSFDPNVSIDFAATATDAEDGNLTADLVWTSDLDGQIGTGGSVSATPSDGVHAVTASVTDADGNVGSDEITITVGTPPTVTVGLFTYGTDGGKDANKHLNVTVALVVENASPPLPVGGAIVWVVLSSNTMNDWGAGGTTGADGRVTYTLKNAPADTYTTRVTAVSAEGYVWEYLDPNNFSVPWTKE